MDQYEATLRFIRDVIGTLTVSASHPDFFTTAVNIDNSLRLIDGLLATLDAEKPAETTTED